MLKYWIGAVLFAMLSIVNAVADDGGRASVAGHAALNDVFGKGFAASVDGTKLAFRTVTIGRIRITSGRLVACDPVVSCGAPFQKPVPIGSFPLQLAIASTGKDERIAYARITFLSARAERWELAVVEGQDVSTLKPGEFFGYGVDSGTGAFMDAAALRHFEAQRNREGEKFDDRLFAEMDKTYKHTRSWHLFETKAGTVAMFSSGYGDGAYPTYRGYDKDGRLVAVVTDFGVLPDK